MSALIVACVSATNSESNDSSNRQKESETILVMGITGNQGSGVAVAASTQGFKSYIRTF